MRHIGIALAAALVASNAGTASAQQLRLELRDGKVTVDDGTGAVVTRGTGAVAQTALGLATIKLTPAQKDSLAKLRTARERAIAAEDARYTAAVRSLLTPEQRTQLDSNVVKAQEQQKALLGNLQLIMQSQMSRQDDDAALKKLDEPDDGSDHETDKP